MKKKSYHWEYPSIRSVWANGARKGRGLRILPDGTGYFVHVTSRARGQAFLFGDREKRVFVRKMREWADFSGIGVITYCVMDNHFHLMLWVPVIEEVSHEEIVEKLAGVWPEGKVKAWEETYRAQPEVKQERMDGEMIGRMGDLPEFMRVLKRSFSCWYNAEHDQSGTLWDSRYRSVVVEANPLALMSVAAYIDLNPVRAGLVQDPLSYLWSGYGSASGGNGRSREGLEVLVRCSRGILPGSAETVRRGQLTEDMHWREVGKALKEEQASRAAPKKWKEVQSSYRIWLYFTGNDGSADLQSRERSRDRHGFDPVDVIAEFEKAGEVPMAKLLLQRQRYFTRGVGIGSTEFLEGMMEQFRG
nr:hypothetical protein [Kiritimatiellia bacterium]